MVAIVERTQFFISAGGVDISNVFAPILINLNVTDNSGQTADTCKIVVDDTGGIIDMPQEGAHIIVAMGQIDGPIAVVFDGIVDDVTSVYDRGSGMTLEIDGKSADTKGKGKTKRRKHHDNKTVGDALKDAGKYAGVQVDVAPRIAQIKRPYQAQDNESFFHFAQRYARQFGGTLKVIGGNRAVMLDRNGGQTVGGGGIGTVTAAYGVNLISSRMSPIITRPRYEEILTRWYDYKAAKWKEEKFKVPIRSGGGGGSSGGGASSNGGGEAGDLGAAATSPGTLPGLFSGEGGSAGGGSYGGGENRNSREDKELAKESAKGAGKESDREKGLGGVIIDGDPRARAEGICQVVGVRPGIDGTYTIHTAKHDLTRGNGYTTDLDLRRPEGGAGANKAGGAGRPEQKHGGSGGTTPLPPLYG